MIQSIFILSLGGEILIERHLRPSISSSRAPCDHFWRECQKFDDSFENGGGGQGEGEQQGNDIPPILTFNETHIISVFRSSLILLCTCTRESPPLLSITFLHHIADMFESYFGSPLDEGAIKENFSTVYQLLEEMNDHGYPLTTEPNALEAMIMKPTVISKIQQVVTGSSTVSSRLPDGTVSNMPWRRSNVRYAQNEIYVDLVEEMDCILTSSGQVVQADINGSIQCVSKLSGVPDLCLTFRDPGVVDDCSFHPCVRYGRWGRERVVSFVPPDGNFELMRYRVKNLSQLITPPIFCTPSLVFNAPSTSPSRTPSGRISVVVGLKSSSSLIYPSNKGPMLLEDIVVTIPFPHSVKTANLNATMGTVLYDEAKKIARWAIPKIGAQTHAELKGEMMLTGGDRPEESPPLRLEWKIPTASVSGLAVSGLSVINENYKPYKGVRTITKSGKFTVRTN